MPVAIIFGFVELESLGLLVVEEAVLKNINKHKLTIPSIRSYSGISNSALKDSTIQNAQ